MQNSRLIKLRYTVIAASVHLMFSGASAWANPTGPQVVTGSASFQQGPGALNVTNAPGTIINWQGFSIGAQELTRFIQQSPSSAVLNRVVGGDISQIHGQLLSNGRVFLINPSGIVIGPGATVDTAGFVASTLNMLDGDFIAGKLKFQGDASSGSIVNQGWIRTGHGGQVILIAPHIENSGLIHTPGGELILAAGQKLTITSMQNEGVQFEVQAPTDSVLNVGQLLADGGAVGVFAGTLRHSGDIRANALVQDEAGRVVLKAQGELRIDAGSTISADGGSGGRITIDAGQGSARVAGRVTAQGSNGQGGSIEILGDRVAVVENAVVNASGSAGGGQILVGGDFQGANPVIRNASNTFVGSAAVLNADATQSGDGGRIIVWSDDKAQFYGNLSARGGPSGGNGGFAEVSGKQNLVFAGGADLGAPRGSLGTLLLDPLDLFVFSGGGIVSSVIDESTDFPSNVATVSPATLAAINGNVSLYASRYLRISDPITLTTPGQSFTATVGTYTLPLAPDPLALSTGTIFNELEIGANITTAGGAVSLNAPIIQSVATSLISTSGGVISLVSSGGAIQASALSLNAGGGAVNATSGSFLQLGAVTGGSFTATAPSSISTGAITTSGGDVNLSSTASSISTGTITLAGGSVSASGASGVFTSTIDTSGNVELESTGGSISSTVNNAASLTATASGSAIISSSTNINVASVTAGSLGTASLSTTGGSILATGPASQVTGRDVTLVTGQGTGGGIGTAGTALNVDVARIFTFRPNGEFNVLLNGSGPNSLAMQMGVAPISESYSGTLAKIGGGLSLSASATDSMVTLSNLSVTSGFDQIVGGVNPSISFNVPNGALTATSVAVPAGSLSPLTLFNVSLSSSDDLTLVSYTRAPGGVSKQTSISSSAGAVNLGTVDASNDNVTVNASGDITISSLTTTGNVSITSSLGAVQAQADNPDVEVSAGGSLSISAAGIGDNVFNNPLDLTGSTVTLTSHSGGVIGSVGNPVVANTQNLVIDADSGSAFNVSTGTTDIINLTVKANAGAVAGGPARVTSNGALYDFNADADNTRFTFDLNGGTLGAGHFAGGKLEFTATSGDISLPVVNLGTGNLVLTANSGAISASDTAISAANVTLSASGSVDTDTGAITASNGSIVIQSDTSVTTGDLNAPQSVEIGRWCVFTCAYPAINVGNVTAPQSIIMNGSSVATGAISGGAIELTAGSGVFSFTDISGGEVFINSPAGIQQTGGSGITAGTISLLASSGDINKTGNVPMDLNGVDSLTVDSGGQLQLDGNGTPLSSLSITKRTTHNPVFTGFGSQLIDFSVNGNFDLEVNSASALDFTLVNLTGNTVRLIGGGIVTGGGNLSLDSFLGGGIDNSGGISTGGGAVSLRSSAGIDNSGGITTGGGFVYMEASGGSITTGTINTGGGSLEAITYCGLPCNIDVSGNLTAGAGAVTLYSTSNASITGSGTISSSNAVYIDTPNGTIGTALMPLAISSPGPSSSTVTLSAGRGGSAVDDEGTVWATLSNRNALSLTGAYGFDVSSDTAFNTLSVTTRASGLGPVDLLATGQSFTFTREAVDLFGTAGNFFRVGSVTGTLIANATFGVSDGTLLVAGPTMIAATNLTLSGAVSLQGTALQPLSLTGHTNQTFTSPTSVLIKGNVTLQAGNSQTFNGGLGNITIDADAGGGGGILISAPNQTFTTTGGSSKIEILGGAAANESVTVTSTNQQQVNSTSTSIDSFKLKGGGGSGSSATFSHSGSGVQDFNISGGTLTVEGGSGQNAFAKIEETGTNQQKICRVTFFGCIPVASLQILGGSGAGAYAQITANGSQNVGVSSSALIKAGSGDGAYALLQAGTSATQTIFGGGALTVEGQGGPGATAAAQILATGAQNITAGSITITGGSSAGSLAQIATTGSQNISASSLALNGSDADAVIEGHSQAITVSAGSIALDGSGAGTTALRSLSGSQTINAGSGGVILGNSGSGTVTLNSAGTQSITTRYVDVSTDIGSAGDSRVFAAGNQRIHTTNGNFGPNGSLRVAALGTGTASIASGGSQLLEIDYPESMQVLGEPGSLVVGDANAAGTSSISAVDQNIIAGTVLIQSGGDNSLSQIKASNTQSISTLLGGIDITGGSGANSLATIDPIIQTILVNGPITLLGGSGLNADASIVSAGAQTILTTNGNILLTGGPGSGADAFISGGSPQQIFASGSIILQPVTGDAFISGPPSVFFFDTTSLILPLEEELEDTLSDTIPVTTEDPLSGRELPICR